jgi:hypothetical protein
MKYTFYAQYTFTVGLNVLKTKHSVSTFGVYSVVNHVRLNASIVKNKSAKR